MHAAKAVRFIFLFAAVMLLQACTVGKYIYWHKNTPIHSDAVNGLFAYQYIALNQVDEKSIAAYCINLKSQAAAGYQLYLLQLSCAERWLAVQQSAEKRLEAVAYYNSALMPLVRAAIADTNTRSLNLVLQLKLDTDESGQAFDKIYLAADIQAYDQFIVPQKDNGVGITVVGQRSNNEVGWDRYFPPEGIFRPLTLIPVKLDFSDPVLPVLTLRGVYHQKQQNWYFDRQEYPLNFDPASAYMCLVEMAVADQLESDGLFNADKVEDKLGVYAIEPLDVNKIPILMVHGLNSSPLIWRRLSWAIYSQPQLSARYQIWHAFYPSGPPPFFNAMRLRKKTDELLQLLSPEPTAALSNMVVIGHSMGGIITKTFVQNSEMTLWDTTFNKPPARLHVDEETRQTLQDIFIFSARDYVKTAIFLDTPHQGAESADSWLGRLASAMITLPFSVKKVFTNLWTGITAKDIKPEMRIYMSGYGPNSVDVLSPKHPLVQQLNNLPFQVPVFSVIGNNDPKHCLGVVSCTELNDSVVPYASAHLNDAVAEVVVPSKHNSYQSPKAIEFILGILSSNVKAEQ